MRQTTTNELIFSSAPSELELHAYVDGLLDETGRIRVERYLAEWPEEAARLAAYRGQNQMLRHLYKGDRTQRADLRLYDEEADAPICGDG